MMRTTVAACLFAAALPAQSTGAAPEPTVTIEGRVIDLRGEPVPVAAVTIVTWKDPDTVLARGTGDGDGFFRIARVPTRQYLVVRATAAGRNVASRQVGAALLPVTLRLHDAATLHGVLRDAKGAPVQGAVVRAADTSRALDAADGFATTGEDGSFRLARVPLGPVRVAAAVPGEGHYLLDTMVTGDAEVALARAPGPTTSLLVAVTGLPADATAEVSISLLPGGAYSRLPPPWHRPRLRPDGTCLLADLPDTDYEVQLGSTRYGFLPPRLRVKQGQGPHRAAFTAQAIELRGQQVLAVLRDADGQPLGGVKLALRASNSSQRAEATSDDAGKLVFASHLGDGAAAIFQSLDDRWALDQVKQERPGGLDHRTLAWHEFTIAAGTTTELCAVAACEVTGRLLRADGRPAPFASVALEQQSSNRWPRWMAFAWATTDADGRYRFRRLHHLPDSVRVAIEGPDGAALGEPLALAAPGACAAVPDLTLSAPATIEGVVRDAEQRPAPGIRVWLRDWDFAQNGQRSGSVVEGITDRLGRYRFAGVPPGGAWLQVLAGADERHVTARAVEPFEVEPGKTYTHDLQVPAK